MGLYERGANEKIAKKININNFWNIQSIKAILLWVNTLFNSIYISLVEFIVRETVIEKQTSLLEFDHRY